MADAFEVMRKVNALLGAKQARRTQRKGCRDHEGELEISPLRQQRPPLLQPIEPNAMDINEIKRTYGAHISIIGNIDLGYTLTRGTPDEVWKEVRQRIHDLAPGGGYAVSTSNSVPEYVPLANYNAMREATFTFGRYPIAV